MNRSFGLLEQEKYIAEVILDPLIKRGDTGFVAERSRIESQELGGLAQDHPALVSWLQNRHQEPRYFV